MGNLKGTIDSGKLSKKVDLSILYRVKTKPGLYYPAANPSKNGFVRMIRYGGSDEAYTVNKKDCQGPLSGVVIYQKGMKAYPLSKVLDRLQKHFKGEPVDIEAFIETLENWPLEPQRLETLEIICPDVDPGAFKIHHVKRALTWYNEILQRSKIENFNSPSKL